MVYIASERLAFAFDRLTAEDGGEFERFVNAFLAKEIPGLRPVAGMHDGARDAFVYQVDTADTSFLQSSVTQYWKKKVRETITALQKNGHTVREFIYCSPLAIIADADSLRAELRSLNISLDVRDRNYFLCSANSTPKQSELCETFAQKYVDAIFAREGIAQPSGMLLTNPEEQLALVYLDLQLADKSADTALTKCAFEALVRYALRDTTPQSLRSRDEILTAVLRAVPSHDEVRVETLVNSTLDRLVRKRVVNHHRSEDGFTLCFEHRTMTTDALVALAVEKNQLLTEIVMRVNRTAATAGIDYEFDAPTVARDIMSILTLYFGKQGRNTARAIVSGRDYRPPFTDPDELCRKAISKWNAKLESLAILSEEKFMDIVPPTIDDIMCTPTAVSLSYLRRLADATLLMFFLRENPDVQKTMEKVFHGGRLLVDASYIVPCLAETVLPEPQRRFTALLSAAKEFGMKLYVGDDGLNELMTHFRRVRSEVDWVRSASSGIVMAESLLARAFLNAYRQGKVADLDSFVFRFMGKDDPKQDLIDTMGELLGIEYEPFSDEIGALDPTMVTQLTNLWKKLKWRRGDLDQQAFDILAEHDARAYLLVQSLRSRDRVQSKYGYTVWFLTLDHVGFRISREAKKIGTTFATPVGSCMSPDFLLRYLSIRPRTQTDDTYLNKVLPLSVELAGIGLVPHELRDAARAAVETVKNEPAYVQRRKLRDFLNKAMVEAGEVLNSGVTSTMRHINET